MVKVTININKYRNINKMARRLTPEVRAAREAEKARKRAERENLRTLKRLARERIKAELKNNLLYLTNVRKAEIEEAVQALSDRRAELKQSKLAEKERLRDLARADLIAVKSIKL
jgi:hypothetical protein